MNSYLKVGFAINLAIGCVASYMYYDRQRKTIYFIKLSGAATIPTRNTPTDAGMDLYSNEDVEIKAGDKALVHTGVACRMSDDTYYLRIAPRSGFSWNNHTDIGAGVIDAGYRGEIKVLVFNHSNNNMRIGCGAKIAQLIPTKTCYPVIKVVDSLDTTQRGAKGFGSSDSA